MFNSILFAALSLMGSVTFACPSTSLNCSLQLIGNDGSVQVVGQANSPYYANPLQCMARVAIQSPDNTLQYRAVSSADGSVIIFTAVGGKPDYSLSASGNGNTEPVVLENGSLKMTCQLK